MGFSLVHPTHQECPTKFVDEEAESTGKPGSMEMKGGAAQQFLG